MNGRAAVAEFIGTFALCYVGVLAIHHFQGVAGGLLAIAFAHGLTIAVMATATGSISGGHLNPAVTLVMLLAKKVTAADACAYVVAQIAAGFAAGAVLLGTYDPSVIAAGTPQLADGITMAQAFTAEILATFMLVFVIFGAAVHHKAPEVGGIYIGFAVMVGILAVGPLTGAAMNPARWLGTGVIGGVFENPALYFAGPVLGALLAAVVYKTLFEGYQPKPEPATDPN